MTVNELRAKFNEFELYDWPKVYYVDHETYANVCQYIFQKLGELTFPYIQVALGANNGIMFKNVELILEHKNDKSTT